MDESDLNTLVRNNLSFGFKIPDPIGMTALSASSRCFDGFGIILENTGAYPVYWESKFSKKLQAFNLKKIETHQADNLSKIADLLPSARTWVIYGVHAGHGDTRLYVFDWRFLRKRYKDEENVLKKHLDNLPYNKVKKGIVVFEHIIKEISDDC